MHNAPAPEIGPRGDGSVSGQNNGPVELAPVPEHVLLAHEATGVYGTGDNAHRFLSVVASMPQTVAGGRQQLQLAKPAVDLLGRLVSWQPIRTSHEQQPQSHP